jgi:hypothetical protein
MIRKFIKIFFGLVLFVTIIFGIVYKNYPIILKWLSGSARIVGKPINAVVFTNGNINNDIKVYRIDNAYWNNVKSNDYLLSLKEFDIEGKLKFINIDLNEKWKWVGRPSGTSINDYDIINGYLFQSEVGGRFSSFQDDMKGYNFNPELNSTDKEIKFKIPPKELKFDSIRIVISD